MQEISIGEKPYLTLSEASEYFNIGINKLREITNEDKGKLVIFVGNKRLIKRKYLESLLDATYSI